MRRLRGRNHGDDGWVAKGNKFITKDFPGSFYTQLYDLNDAGNFCGIHNNQHGYSGLISIAKTYTSFKIPGSGFTFAFGINNLNQSVGSYSNDIEEQSFSRDPDGALTYPIDAPGSVATALYGIHDRGWTVGGSVGAIGTSSGVIFFSAAEIAT